MTYGLEIWDENGVKTLGTSDAIGLVVGEGSISVPGDEDTVTTVTVPGTVASDHVFLADYPGTLHCQIAFNAPDISVTSVAGSGVLKYLVVRTT